MSWNEANLHRWLGRALRARGVLGAPLSDAAVLAAGLEHAVLCADQVIEGVHFAAGTAAARVGRKAADRVLSDLAASAAVPRALLATVAAPRTTTERDLRALLAALRARGRAFGAELVGGDLACTSGPLSVSVAGVGEWRGPGRPPTRAGARPGDLVFATGPCGGSALGRHLALEPRVDAARWLVAHGARALMDVSDGLALDLARLARASRVRIDLAAVPVHADARRAARSSGRAAREHALYDGEDHELLACIPPARVDALLAEAPRRCPGLAYVGSVRAGRGLWLCDEPRMRRFAPRRGRGWIHGA